MSRWLIRLIAIACLLAVALPAAAQDEGGDPILEEMWQLFGSVMSQLSEASEATDTESHDHGDTHDHEASESAEVTVIGDFGDIPQSRGEDGAFILGDPNAPVTIIEFADFACPHCQNYKPTMDQFIEEYVRPGFARFEFRTYPTAGGQLTYFAGLIAECAEEQVPGGFWAAHEYFYMLSSAGRFNERLGENLANEYDLDYEALLTCAETAEQVTTDIMFGQKNSVGGTPAVLVRYGDNPAEVIVVDGVRYDRGGVPYEILERVVMDAAGV